MSQPPHYRSKRLFFLAALQDNHSGWYFTLRGGTTHGPFPDQASAQQALDHMVESLITGEDRGGR